MNKFTGIGVAAVILAAVGAARGGWVSAALLGALGVVNLVIGYRTEGRPLIRNWREGPVELEWHRVLLSGFSLFLVVAAVLFLLIGEPIAAVAMSGFTIAPITIYGIVVAYRRDRQG